MGSPPRFLARLRTASRAPSADDEVVRRLADAPLGRRQPEFGAHRAVEEGVGVDRRRPDLFIEPGDENPIERKKPRFEQAKDGKARMAAGRGGRAHAGERALEQPGILGQACRGRFRPRPRAIRR